MTTKTTIQKQIRAALDRAFEKKEAPLSSKWKAIILDKVIDEKPHLLLFHYQHLVLVYDVNAEEGVYQWYEKPADKRGLESALLYLEERAAHSVTKNIRGIRSEVLYVFD